MDREDKKYIDMGLLSTDDSIREAVGIKVGDEITDKQAKTFYDRGYIDILVKNDKGESRLIPAWHSNETQKELSRELVKDKKTGKDSLKITGNKVDLPKFEQVIQDIKKELGNNIKFYTQSPESNKAYPNEIENEDDVKDRVTGKAYKLFKVVDGKLYPPIVKNTGAKETPTGVWIKCGSPEFVEISSSWGKPQVSQTSKGNLSFRAGWHLGELPYAPQFESKKNPGYLSSDKFVWAECDYDATVDYQDRAMSYGFTKDGKFTNSAAGLPYRPIGGYYKYRTNPNPNTIAWVITGSMKVNKVLSDAEVEKICKDNNVPYLKRPGGDKTLKELGLHESMTESLNEDYIYDEDTGSRILITTSAPQVADRIKSTPDSLRILYDDNIKKYMVCYHNNIIHRNMIDAAIDNYYYPPQLDVNRYNVSGYLDEAEDEDKLFYLIFAPTHLIDDTYGAKIPEDDYDTEYYYDFGVITSRHCNFKECPLYKVLPKPNKIRTRYGWSSDGSRPLIQEESYQVKKVDTDVTEIDEYALDELLEKLQREGYGVWPYDNPGQGYGFVVYSGKKELTKDNDIYYFIRANLDYNTVATYKGFNKNILDGKEVDRQKFNSVDELDEIIHNQIESITPQNTIIDVKEDLNSQEQEQLDEIDKLIDDIYALRQQSIQQDGEFGIGNLVFKEFRNMGYLDNLKNLKTKLQSKKMSLENLEENK